MKIDMKLQRIFPLILGIVFCSHALAQDMDKELSDLAEKLAAPIKEQGKKKIAVVDFTDLQGSSSGELGKYIAEQLTVNMVMGKRDFSMLDRANLKSILAEHKLTAMGLIDPENAKKLGQFAGVDALILGTIVPKGNDISLTAKIITTDTAVVIGAARAQFKSDDVVKELVAKPATTDGLTAATAPPPPKLFGDLQAKVLSISLLPDNGSYGFARLTMIVTNASDSITYGVAVDGDFYNTFNLSNDRGDEFKATEVSGIGTGGQTFMGFQAKFTEVPPKSAIKLVSKSQVRWSGKPGEYRPYHFQTEFYFGIESQGRYTDLKKYNCVLDVK